MGSVNAYNTKIDQTVHIFDKFYNYAVDVPSQEYDAVYSFFRSIYGTAEAAGNFSVTLFRVAQQSDIPVMNLLQQMEGLNQAELTLTLTYYLNGIRSPSTLLGLNVPVTPSFYVARNIRS